MKTLKQIAKEEGLKGRQFKLLTDYLLHYDLELSDKEYDDELMKFMCQVHNWDETIYVSYKDIKGIEKVAEIDILDILTDYDEKYLKDVIKYWEKIDHKCNSHLVLDKDNSCSKSFLYDKTLILDIINDIKNGNIVEDKPTK